MISMFGSPKGHYERASNERNSYRGFADKFLGRNKTTAEDLQREEANRLNVLVDKRVSNDAHISAQEASDQIVSNSSEFATDFEGLDQISEDERAAIISEYIKQELPEVEQYANEGDFVNAVEVFASRLDYKISPLDGAEGTNSEEVDQLEADFYGKYLLGKVESAILANDSEPLYKFIERFNVREIPSVYAQAYADLLGGHFTLLDDTTALESLDELKERIYDRKMELEEIARFVRETLADKTSIL